MEIAKQKKKPLNNKAGHANKAVILDSQVDK